jgi:hypothetical protein
MISNIAATTTGVDDLATSRRALTESANGPSSINGKSNARQNSLSERRPFAQPEALNTHGLAISHSGWKIS